MRSFAAGLVVALLVAACNATPASPQPSTVPSPSPVLVAEKSPIEPTLSATPSATATPTPTATATPVASPSPTPSRAASPKPSATPSAGASLEPAPPVEAGAAWTTTAVALLGTAGATSTAQAHVGSAFPLDLTSKAVYAASKVWVQARWKTPGRSGTAWVPEASLTRVKPAAIATANIDALDAALGTYLANLGSRVGVEVYDRTRGAIYVFNADRQYTVASSIKIEIMCAFIDLIEEQHREPTSYELTQLTRMIENSDNTAASYFYKKIGDAAGMTAYMKEIGVSGLTASPSSRGWGWSTISPAAQVRVLTLLWEGKLMNEEHRELALKLMGHVEADQRQGVADTAPKGSTWAMKVGWVNGPDGMMVMNSSGIVTLGAETWIVSVYTVDDTSLAQGWGIANHVCAAIAAKLQ